MDYIAVNLPHTWGLKGSDEEWKAFRDDLPHTWGLKDCRRYLIHPLLYLPHTWGLKDQAIDQ